MAKIGDERAARRVIAEAVAQQALALAVIAGQNGAGADQGRGRDDHAGRLDEAEPFEMGKDVGIGGWRS
ncbi:hypothetical protein [Chloroflexus sp.]|uniref:hypothetical protein n=1 Tax=Chloroflexus sp. TaxID=1904827 RepID=UPI002ACD71D1|nr:hypothetical protein [Chloroflexus sp.]